MLVVAHQGSCTPLLFAASPQVKYWWRTKPRYATDMCIIGGVPQHLYATNIFEDAVQIYWWRTKYWYATNIPHISGVQKLWYATYIVA